MKKHLVGMTGLFFAIAAVSANAADLRVKGYIVPASCSFTITNSVIDYGRIDPNTLSPTTSTRLAAKSTPYTIKCGTHAKAKVGIKAIDNRAATRVPSLVHSHWGGNYTDTYNYGLGATASGQKIGGYTIHLRNSVADSRAVGVITSSNNGGSWHAGGQALGHANNIASWHTGNALPVALNVLSGTMEVQAIINKTSELSLSSQINLDGQATLELRYL
ncbi:DUF1120 domain-containing protein [Pseudomonas syringae]|uniref:DUF1120 domain-containing protein n=1 Tax=Pseudomonas syringae TaxID=317 RepID=UPI001F30B9D7|nr:DUF1120 domain-containing protein [Pseudomonas syringae]MCF5721101.1 DUF1120 domain-containing protein [Pseudomonas syringae]